MNNLYHKVAVASVCTALSFTLGANQEAKAATLAFGATTFFIDETNNDGFGDRLYTDMEPDPFSSGHAFTVSRGRYGEKRSFHEFFIDNLSFIKSAIFSIQSDDWQPNYLHPYLQIFGYVGNGRADLSDYEAGESLGIQISRFPDRINFDVTRFVNERVSKRDAFVGFGIRVSQQFAYFYNTTGHINNTYYRPLLIIETDDVTEPVPEPTTIFGSALALGVGGWLKRKKSGQQNKTTSH